MIFWVAGAGPGGQKGMCLLGIGVEERGVLKVRVVVRGGGVVDWSRRAECC